MRNQGALLLSPHLLWLLLLLLLLLLSPDLLLQVCDMLKSHLFHLFHL
jgi:hypothetical protein